MAELKKQKIADELGLTGSPEEDAAAVKMQAIQRGKLERREQLAAGKKK